jgi:predicted transcriptional regulator
MRFLKNPEVGKPFNPFKVFRGLMVPDGLASCPDVSPGAKLAYAALVRYGGQKGQPWPSVAKIALRLGVKHRQARRYLESLERHGFIKRIPKSGASNRFQFLWHSVFESRLTHRKNVHISKPGL